MRFGSANPGPTSELPRVIQGRYWLPASARKREWSLSGSPRAKGGQYPEAPRFAPNKHWGISQYSATAANAFDHAVKRRVLAIDWIVRIIHQVLLRGHLISTRLAMPDRRLRYRLLVRAHQRSWGWISRTSRRLRNRHRSVHQGQQRYRRDQLSHDGSPEFGAPLLTIMVAGRLDHKGAQTSRFIQMFQPRWRVLRAGHYPDDER